MLTINLNKSIWAMNFNCGGCNGCYTELLLTKCPVFGAQNAGIKYVQNPIHADALIITGKVIDADIPHIKKLYHIMPKPAIIMALGDCAESAKDYINVDYFAPGCSLSPDKIINEILNAHKSKQNKRDRHNKTEREINDDE